MRLRRTIQHEAGALVLLLAVPAAAAAQSGGGPPQAPAAVTISMDDAIRLALERNQALRAQRLTIDESKADETTAAFRPNLNFGFSTAGLSVFSPSHLTFSTASSIVTYDATLGYTFERGGKRDKRTTVAKDTTDVTARGVMDAERQLRFQTEQAFINVLLAKSTLDLAQQNLKNFKAVVEANRQRVTAGDLAEGDFLPIQLQQLQFVMDLSAAEVGIVQAKALLRQLVGFETVPEDFDVAGDLVSTPVSVTLEDLQREALASRPDLLAAESSVKLAQDSAALERGNRARDIGGSADYTKATGSSTLGVGVTFDLPFGNRNQGNIAHADLAVRQAEQTEAATRFGVLTDVTTAYAALQTSAKVVKLFESGYLDQARRSLEIATFAFQQGASSLLSLLDAERTARDTQVTYRQALATLMTNVQQINFVVGKQVVR
jgi:cobalt-zinc-cadmium efflux system outer membrane protein